MHLMRASGQSKLHMASFRTNIELEQKIVQTAAPTSLPPPSHFYVIIFWYFIIFLYYYLIIFSDFRCRKFVLGVLVLCPL